MYILYIFRLIHQVGEILRCYQRLKSRRVSFFVHILDTKLHGLILLSLSYFSGCQVIRCLDDLLALLNQILLQTINLR